MAELRVDGVKIVSIPDLDVLAEGGVSLLGATGASAEVSDIQIERLRADGRPLEEILREDFADGADDWSLTGASWQASTLHRLDLGDLIDASIVISYKARFDLPE